MATNWNLGRIGRVYAKEEASYATAPTLTATDAFRHLNANLQYNPKNLVDSPARYADPSVRNRFTRRATGAFDLTALFYPSGTIGTKPEASAFLKHGLGAETVSAVSTTVSASPTPTTTGATVASAGTLAAGQAVSITIASGVNAGTYVRILTGVNTNALTWAPALPSAPASLDTVKGGVTYGLATALAKSLDIAHYTSNFTNRELLGCVVNNLSVIFNAAEEPRLQVKGPAQGYAAAAQSDPATFTTVGTDAGIPSGLTGGLYVGDVLVEMLKLQLDIDNAMELQNTEFGHQKAYGYFRKGRRQVSLSIDALVSDQTTLYTAALGATSVAIFAQCGTTEGKQIAIYCPAVVFDHPDTPDGDETNTHSFKGKVLATAANNECIIAVC